MAKPLRNIVGKDTNLKGVKSSKVEKTDLSDWEKSPDGRRFAGKHTIEKHVDRVGNGEEDYKGNTKEAPFPKQKASVYEASCNMTEAGKMCEVHGTKACPTGSKKDKKRLLLDKKDIQEVLSKSNTAGEVIHDIVHSKDVRFKGDTTKQRIKRALGIYYGMHPEKSKKKG